MQILQRILKTYKLRLSAVDKILTPFYPDPEADTSQQPNREGVPGPCYRRCGKSPAHSAAEYESGWGAPSRSESQCVPEKGGNHAALYDDF